MVSVGEDGKMKLWDLRAYKEATCYYSLPPAQTLDVSQRGMLALSYGGTIKVQNNAFNINKVKVWKGIFSERQSAPYMEHQISAADIRVSRCIKLRLIHQTVRFCPY